MEDDAAAKFSPEISHKLMGIYMGGLILGVNTLYRLFCFFKLFASGGKGLKQAMTALRKVV